MRRQFLLAFLASLTLAASPIAADEVFLDEIPESQEYDYVFEDPAADNPENDEPAEEFEITEDYDSTEEYGTDVSFGDDFSNPNSAADDFEV